MITIFLETNALNECIEENLTGKELKEILEAKKYIPVVSLHTTYELVRTYIKPDMRNKGTQLFTLLKELHPIFTCRTRELIQQEILKLKNDSCVDFICSKKDEIALQQAVDNLSLGKFIPPQSQQFIQNRETELKEDKTWDSLLDREKQNASISYDAFIKKYWNIQNLNSIKSHIEQISGVELNDREVSKFFKESSSYLALTTHLRVDLYLNWQVIKHGNKPALDKADDFRHLIDSSYCTLLVTNDKKFKKCASRIKQRNAQGS